MPVAKHRLHGRERMGIEMQAVEKAPSVQFGVRRQSEAATALLL